TINYARTQSRPGTSGTMTQLTQNNMDGRQSPSQGHHSRGHSQSPNRALLASESDHIRAGSDASDVNRRSMIWQPGIATVGGSSGPAGKGLTAEQFVQQRASMVAQPRGYAHQRMPSQNMPRAGTPTDFQSGAHSRNT